MEDIGKLFGKNKNPNVFVICSLLFKSQIEAKITHLLQKDKTLARHNAMGMYYDEIGNIIDTLFETSKPWYNTEDLCVEESCCIKDPIFYFKNLYSEVDKLRKDIKESYIQNQIDEAQQLISHTLYRLTEIIT